VSELRKAMEAKEGARYDQKERGDGASRRMGKEEKWKR